MKTEIKKSHVLSYIKAFIEVLNEDLEYRKKLILKYKNQPYDTLKKFEIDTKIDVYQDIMKHIESEYTDD